MEKWTISTTFKNGYLKRETYIDQKGFFHYRKYDKQGNIKFEHQHKCSKEYNKYTQQPDYNFL